MVTEKLFVGEVLAAGETSVGYRVDLGQIGASGDFGLQVTSSGPVRLYYTASAEEAEAAVADGGVLCDHPGGGSVMYWPVIAPCSSIWVYAAAPAGGAGATVSATLNIW